MRLLPLSLAVWFGINLGLAPAIYSQPITKGTNKNIAPNENLVIEGVPPISTELANIVARYTQFRSASLSSWHPTKKEMLISTRFGDVAQVHQVKFPMGARQQLTFANERVSGASFQPTTGDYFVFSKDVGGNEFAQNYRYDLATGDITLLTDGKSQNGRGIWSAKGDRMLYGSTRRNGQDRDLYIIDPKNPQTDRLVVTNSGGGWGAVDWSKDERQAILQESISVNESYLWLLDLASGVKTRLTPSNSKFRF